MFSRRPRKKKKHKAVFQKEKILTDVGVGLRRGLVDLHHGDHRVGVVGEDAHDREGLFYYFVFFFFSFEKKRKKTSSFFVFLSSFLCPLSFNSLFSQTPPPPFPSSPHLVVQQHRAPGLQQAPVHEAHDRDVVLGPHGARHDRVRLVDDFFQRAHRHGRAAEVVDLRAVAVLVVRFHGSRSPSSSTPPVTPRLRWRMCSGRGAWVLKRVRCKRGDERARAAAGGPVGLTGSGVQSARTTWRGAEGALTHWRRSSRALGALAALRSLPACTHRAGSLSAPRQHPGPSTPGARWRSSRRRRSCTSSSRHAGGWRWARWHQASAAVVGARAARGRRGSDNDPSPRDRRRRPLSAATCPPASSC